jgi:MFS family permease
MARALRIAAPRPGSLGTFRAFQNHSFRLLWPANFLSYVSRWMQITMLSWLVLELTDSPWHVALIAFFSWMPMLVLGLIGGLLADSVNRRNLLVTTQAATLMSTVALAVLLNTGLIEYWHAYVAVSVTGVSWALDMPSRRSIIHDLLGSGGVTNAVALDSVGMNGSRMVGPALAGLLITLVDVKGGYIVIAAFQMASLTLLLLAGVPQGHRNQFRPSRMVRNLREGLGYVSVQRTILATVIVTFLMNLLLFPYQQMIPVIARDKLEVGAFLMGLLQAADGFGALIGAILIASRPNLKYHGRVYVGGSMLGLLAVLVFALSPWYGLSWPTLLVLGLGTSGFGTMQATIVMLTAREEMRGRALGVISLAIGASPLGALMIGAVASAQSPSFAIGLNAILGIASLALVWLLMPSLRQRIQPEEQRQGA